MKTLILLITTISFLSSHAQIQPVWAVSISYVTTHDPIISIDTASNTIVSAFEWRYGLIVNDDTLVTVDQTNLREGVGFVKHTFDGTRQWAFASDTSQYIGDLAIDSEGNIIYLGRFWGITNIALKGDTHLIVSPDDNSHAFLVKYDPDGNLLWVRTFGNPEQNDEPTALTLDQYNNIYVAGVYGQKIVIDNVSDTIYNDNQGLPAEINIFIFDSTGIYKDRLTIETDIKAYIFDLEINDSLLFIAGAFQGKVDFNMKDGAPSQIYNSVYARDKFAVGYDANRNFKWAYTENIGINDYIYNIDVNDSIVIMAAGHGTANHMILDANTGEVRYSQSFSGDNRAYAKYVSLNCSNSKIYAGQIWGAVDFDFSDNTYIVGETGISSNYMAKYDENNNFVWATSSFSTDCSNCVRTSMNSYDNWVFESSRYFDSVFEGQPNELINNTSQGSIYIAGYFDSTEVKSHCTSSLLSVNNEKTFEATTRAYPNPSLNGWQINGIASGSNMTLYSVEGRVLYTAAAKNIVNTIPFQKPGIYILFVEHKNKCEIIRLVHE